MLNNGFDISGACTLAYWICGFPGSPGHHPHHWHWHQPCQEPRSCHHLQQRTRLEWPCKHVTSLKNQQQSDEYDARACLTTNTTLMNFSYVSLSGSSGSVPSLELPWLPSTIRWWSEPSRSGASVEQSWLPSIACPSCGSVPKMQCLCGLIVVTRTVFVQVCIYWC